jgi:hypothetical protein
VLRQICSVPEMKRGLGFSLDIGDDSFAYSLTVGPVVSTLEPSAFPLLGLDLAALFVMRRQRATS